MANAEKIVVLDSSTSFDGLLKFGMATLCIQGKFKGTIESSGFLIVDRGAVVDADHINVNSVSIYGSVTAAIHAKDKIDMLPGAEVKGDITAARLRIADGVLFEGQCSMVNPPDGMDIFAHTLDEIKETLITNASEQ
jgi:cytoskeletal protein CcmA (bactofilin family)